MIPEPWLVLHGAPAQELTVATYLTRVVLSVVALGAVALVAYWSAGVIDRVRPS